MKSDQVVKTTTPEKEINSATLWLFELTKTLIRFSVILLLGWLVQKNIGLNQTWVSIIASLFLINVGYIVILFVFKDKLRKNFYLLKLMHHLSLALCLLMFSMMVIATGREKSDYFLIFAFYLTIIPLAQIDFPFKETVISEILISSAYPVSLLLTGPIKEMETFAIRASFLLAIAVANIVFTWILKREHKMLIAANHKLHFMAITDPLTGLYNRRFLREELTREISRSKRSKSSFSIIISDIDNFKNFNDEFGHIEGDNLLIHVSDIMKSEVRQVDIVARFGGEEFAIVLPSASKTEAAKVAERIGKKIEVSSEKNFGKKVTMTFGIASYPEDAKDEIELLIRADRALLEAKLAGKNRVGICQGILG